MEVLVLITAAVLSGIMVALFIGIPLYIVPISAIMIESLITRIKK